MFVINRKLLHGSETLSSVQPVAGVAGMTYVEAPEAGTRVIRRG